MAEGHKPHSFYYLKTFWKDAFQDSFLRDITADVVKERLDAMAHERHLAPCTRNHYLVQLQAFFKFAMEQGWVDQHPTRGRIPRLRTDNARTRWLRPQEIEAIKAEADPWLRDIIDFAVRSGMRLGEVTTLRVRDYYLDSHGNAFLRTAGPTKNGKIHHWPLEGSVRALVERLIRDRKGRPDRFIFTGPRGGMARPSIKRQLRTAVEAAGLVWGGRGDGISFHTFRHSMASLALNAGVPAEVVQRLGNWRSPAMVQRYGHLADETLRAAASHMDRLLTGRKP